jgi:ribosomal-protein-alanine N-acetyltransferase
MLELQRLTSDHLEAVLAFERENRAYFARSVTDRGDEFYESFAEHHRARLDEQEAGISVFFVLVDHDASVVGRFNLYDLEGGAATVGYRVAERSQDAEWQPKLYPTSAARPQTTTACGH